MPTPLCVRTTLSDTTREAGPAPLPPGRDFYINRNIGFPIYTLYTLFNRSFWGGFLYVLDRLTPLPEFRGNLRERGPRSLKNAPQGFRPPWGSRGHSRGRVCLRGQGRVRDGRRRARRRGRVQAGARALRAYTRVGARQRGQASGCAVFGAKKEGYRAACVGFRPSRRHGACRAAGEKSPFRPVFVASTQAAGRRFV